MTGGNPLAGRDEHGPVPEVKWNDVEWRVDGKIDAGGGVRVVPYLDAPTVARYLDQWVGPFNWRDLYEPAKQGVLWCHIEIRDPCMNDWIRKTDLGTATTMEADKGLVSDAFKRCAMRKWRIGANVFELPTLRLQRGSFDTYTSRNGEQARLTNTSLQAIVRQLHATGYTDAAEKARVNTDGAVTRDDGDRTGADPDHQRLVAAVEKAADGMVTVGMIDANQRAAAVDHARKGVDHAQASLAKLTRLAQDADAESDAVDDDPNPLKVA